MDTHCSDNTINCTVVLPTIRDMPLTRPISLCSTTPSSSSAPTFLLMGPEPLCTDSTKFYFPICPPCACIALETYIGVTHTITCFSYRYFWGRNYHLGIFRIIFNCNLSSYLRCSLIKNLGSFITLSALPPSPSFVLPSSGPLPPLPLSP